MPRGRPALPQAAKRRHRVTLYLRDAEMAGLLKEQRPGEDLAQVVYRKLFYEEPSTQEQS